ncbi:gamma subclass chorismate mutase AroQ [Thiohalocapsa marina]|uniref:gamma subclass chorismate mutase AroQ n=1 Tax=Thiohalocapsa marina TaxID=424902 RepID=UPI0036DE0B9A
MSHNSPQRFARAVSLLLLIGLLFSSASALTAVPPATATLFDLIRARLVLMESVAAAKWPDASAIEDLRREQSVLRQAAQAAERHGLVPTSVEAFYQAQMTAAKRLQRAAFARWHADPDSRPIPTLHLENDLRPRLIDLGEQITAQLALIGGGQGLGATAEDLARHLAGQPLDQADIAALAAGLAAVEPLPATPPGLARILDSGVLRVGTTFDYAPFSALDPDAGQPTGIDIDLAHRLADSLGVRLELVRTRWPSLMEDLLADRFDVGLSGISRTLLRQRQAFFSTPYHRGGKVALGRCQDQRRLASLAAIDQPGVRVVVNPGGTNQAFVESHLTQAPVRVHADNTTLFLELVAGRADVLFTDLIEARLQRQRHPELCLLAGGATLSEQDKAVLLPPDPALKFYVDHWLETLQRDAVLEELFATHMGEDDH